jgi:8-oxo-dGTP pyrophosphatase MutT (NUDIX family)
MSLLPACSFVVVHLILIQKNRVLLGLRTGTGFADGMYGLPAGKVEVGESVLAGMIREAKEELGIEIKEADLELSSMIYHLWTDKVQTQFNLFFVCRKFSGEIVNAEPEKCSGLKFFSLKRLPKNIIPFVAEGLQNYMKKIKYSEFGWAKKTK